ncbi:hypothetical protein HY635_02845 [Candidatus Uhrbacteria bacterium]|nr:hypothetical protein [Candidatus Uhrbacteria bacterium]
MSAYRSEQLLTYLGGPFLILCGIILLGRSIQPILTGADRALLQAVLCFPVPAVLVAYGIYVLREGRKRLASTHWRAEHFE